LCKKYKPTYPEFIPEGTALYEKYQNENEQKTDEITFKIKHDINSHKILNDFLTDANKTNNQSSKIKIHSICVNKKENVIEIDNPEYQTYLDNKEIVSKIIDKGGNIPTMLSPVPPKIQKISYSKEIVSTFINERQKSFDTLYLKKKDEELLQNLLDNYNKNNIFDKLGLPKKLGILLYGVPGTGKSTTIQVIASYLKKDIYYINMNNVETCADMKLMFDYVMKNCNNGGILVFEDIDAQTDIVHSREDVEYQTVTSVIENQNDKLNLQ